MVNPRRNPTTLTGQIRNSVVIRKECRTVLSGQLRDKRSIRLSGSAHVIGKHDRIERSSPGTFVLVQLSLAGDEQSSNPTRIALNDARYIALPVFQSVPI